MSKLRFTIYSSMMVLAIVVLMGGLLIMNNISFSLPEDNPAVEDIEIKNVEVIKSVESERVDGPNIVGKNINLDIDLLPYEVYSFRYDITNLTNSNYLLKDYTISVDNEDILDNITVEAYYENGDLIKNNTLIPANTKRTIYVTVKYDKNIEDVQSFKLYLDTLFDRR